MKSTTFLALFTALCIEAYGQLSMSPGDTYVFRFQSLQNYGTSFGPIAGAACWVTAIEAVDAEDSLQIELFENGIDAPAVANQTFSPSDAPAQLHSPSAWNDHTGSVRITALSGSFTLTEITVRYIRPNPFGTFDRFETRVPLVPFSGAQIVDNSLRLSVQATDKKRYTIEANDQLSADEQWTPIGVTVENRNGAVTLQAGDASLSRRFYRLRIEDASVTTP
jgi:hypothetical protein